MPYKDPERARERKRQRYRETRDQRMAKIKEWQDANPEKVKQIKLDSARRRRQTVREFVNAFKTANPCVDCGGRFPAPAMQFDHVEDNKTANVSHLVTRGYALEIVVAEIEKCELVCANCHSIRTHARVQESRLLEAVS